MQIHFLQPTHLLISLGIHFYRKSALNPYGLRFSKKECNSDMYIAMEFCETPDGGVAASHDSLVVHGTG